MTSQRQNHAKSWFPVKKLGKKIREVFCSRLLCENKKWCCWNQTKFHKFCRLVSKKNLLLITSIAPMEKRHCKKLWILEEKKRTCRKFWICKSQKNEAFFQVFWNTIPKIESVFETISMRTYLKWRKVTIIILIQHPHQIQSYTKCTLLRYHQKRGNWRELPAFIAASHFFFLHKFCLAGQLG